MASIFLLTHTLLHIRHRHTDIRAVCHIRIIAAVLHNLIAYPVCIRLQQIHRNGNRHPLRRAQGYRMAFYPKQKLYRCCLCRRCTARSCRNAQPELFLIFDYIFFHTHFQSVKSSLFIPFHTEIVNLFPFPLCTSISNLGFSAYFLPPTPTAWVFPVLYSLPRPLHYAT